MVKRRRQVVEARQFKSELNEYFREAAGLGGNGSHKSDFERWVENDIKEDEEEWGGSYDDYVDEPYPPEVYDDDFWWDEGDWYDNPCPSAGQHIRDKDGATWLVLDNGCWANLLTGKTKPGGLMLDFEVIL